MGHRGKHGDGACFSLKTRIIRFLHQSCGFDVLAFESGLYDCRAAWELIRALPPGGDAVNAMGAGVFAIWMRSAQLEPLARYVAEQARTTAPWSWPASTASSPGASPPRA